MHRQPFPIDSLDTARANPFDSGQRTNQGMVHCHVIRSTLPSREGYRTLPAPYGRPVGQQMVPRYVKNVSA
jgi:hypothetical protein